MKTVINVPWCFTIVLFGVLVLRLFVPILTFEAIAGAGVLLVLSAGIGICLEGYFVKMGWRKKK